jgi:hypothetical protein
MCLSPCFNKKLFNLGRLTIVIEMCFTLFGEIKLIFYCSTQMTFKLNSQLITDKCNAPRLMNPTITQRAITNEMRDQPQCADKMPPSFNNKLFLLVNCAEKSHHVASMSNSELNAYLSLFSHHMLSRNHFSFHFILLRFCCCCCCCV